MCRASWPGNSSDSVGGSLLIMVLGYGTTEAQWEKF